MAILPFVLGLHPASGLQAADIFAPGRGEFLVVLPSADVVTLQPRRFATKEVSQPAGLPLAPLMVPVKMLLEAGFKPVFASPKGTLPVLDPHSDTAAAFNDDQAAYQEHRRLCVQLGVCASQGTVGSLRTEKLSVLIAQGLNRFSGVFVPDSFAALADLYADRSVGEALSFFHQYALPTALLGHGVAALLATLSEPATFALALEQLKIAEIKKERDALEIARISALIAALGKGWLYRGYNLTTYTRVEERAFERGGRTPALDGYLRFYPDQALATAGAHLRQGPAGDAEVVIDRELITGQNAASVAPLAQALLEAVVKANTRPLITH